jgi:prepilin-type N-terminal cleavage/methylation domain-containing protein
MDMIKQRAAMRGQGGFTLVELLVAVAILAILAGVAVFAVGNLTSGANEAACETEAQTIKTAVAAANATPDENDVYTANLDGTPEYFTVTTTGSGNEVVPTLTPTGANTSTVDGECVIA